MKRIGVLAALICGMVSTVEAQSFCVLYAFSGSSDGGNPYGGLVMGSSGSLYGTTNSGGISNLGVVFEVKKDTCNQGENNVLHEFGSIKNDGQTPFDTLLIDPTGKKYLYGTTFNGGRSGVGTVFELSIPGRGIRIIDVYENWGFQHPYAGLGETSSAFYGTAYYGGTQGQGGVFAGNQ